MGGGRAAADFPREEPRAFSPNRPVFSKRIFSRAGGRKGSGILCGPDPTAVLFKKGPVFFLKRANDFFEK
jgi:hypothetical protein